MKELYVKRENRIEPCQTSLGTATKKKKNNISHLAAAASLLVLLLAAVAVVSVGVGLSGELSSGSFGAFVADRAVAFGFGLPNANNSFLPSEDEFSGGDESNTEDSEGSSENSEETEETEESGDGSSEDSAEDLTEDPTEIPTEDSAESSDDGTEESDEEEELSSENIGIPVVSADLSQAEKGIYYIINNTSQKPDVQTLTDKELDTGYIPNSPYPLVLVLHTHTGESYSTDGKYFERENGGLYSVAGVGETFGRVLNENGIVTVHCTVIHDGESNIDSYARAAETIETMLKMYPTIKYVIDLHRSSQVDEDGNVIRTLCSAGGVDTAQIGITVGMGGAWEDNLSLALKIKTFLGYEDAYLSRPVTLSGSKFNAEMSRYYLTIDVGSCGNTFEESQRAAEFLALALARVIKG